MAKLKENTVVIGRDGQPQPLAAGDDVPKWAAKQVGDHLLEEAKPSRSSRSSKAPAGPAVEDPEDDESESESENDGDDASSSDGDDPGGADETQEPPRAGRGSGVEAWRSYATGLGLEVPEDAGRDDIVALVDARG